VALQAECKVRTASPTKSAPISVALVLSSPFFLGQTHVSFLFPCLELASHLSQTVAPKEKSLAVSGNQQPNSKPLSNAKAAAEVQQAENTTLPYHRIFIFQRGRLACNGLTPGFLFSFFLLSDCVVGLLFFEFPIFGILGMRVWRVQLICHYAYLLSLENFKCIFHESSIAIPTTPTPEVAMPKSLEGN